MVINGALNNSYLVLFSIIDFSAQAFIFLNESLVFSTISFKSYFLFKRDEIVVQRLFILTIFACFCVKLCAVARYNFV